MGNLGSTEIFSVSSEPVLPCSCKGKELQPEFITKEHFYLEMASYQSDLCPSLAQ